MVHPTSYERYCHTLMTFIKGARTIYYSRKTCFTCRKIQEIKVLRTPLVSMGKAFVRVGNITCGWTGGGTRVVGGVWRLARRFGGEGRNGGRPDAGRHL